MPHYFGHPLPTIRQGRKMDVSSALKKKGIELLRAAPCDVVVDILTYVPVPQFAVYISLLCCLVYSLATKSKVPISREHYHINVKNKTAPPVSYPPVCLEVRNPSQNATKWLVDHGFEETEIREKVYWVNDGIGPISLTYLGSNDCIVPYQEKNFVPYGHLNYSALLDLIELNNLIGFALNILTEFMPFITAPGWTDRDSVAFANPTYVTFL